MDAIHGKEADMADEITETVMQEDTPEPEVQQQQEKTFTQAEVDAIVKARLERASKKASNDGDAATREELAKTRAELDELRKSVERKELVASAAKSSGVPAELIHGTTKEEIDASAAALKAWMDSKPASYPSTDEGTRGGKVSAVTKAEIAAIKNPKERYAAIVAHPELF